MYSKRVGLVPIMVIVLAAFGMPSCAPSKPSHSVSPAVPRGYVSTLSISRDDRILRFGPFVGYYFRPSRVGNMQQLDFVCFNERNFYTTDVPAHTRLYEGTAIMVTLPDAGRALPDASRINPVFFQEAPSVWKDSRPEPRNEYRHFHSCYNAAGPVRTGYWLRHVALTNVVYDMGGRVAAGSPLFHTVVTGVDTGFARLIEFDAGPSGGAASSL